MNAIDEIHERLTGFDEVFRVDENSMCCASGSVVVVVHLHEEKIVLHASASGHKHDVDLTFGSSEIEQAVSAIHELTH